MISIGVFRQNNSGRNRLLAVFVSFTAFRLHFIHPFVSIRSGRQTSSRNRPFHHSASSRRRRRFFTGSPVARRLWMSSSLRLRPSALRAVLRCRAADAASGSNIVCEQGRVSMLRDRIR